MTPEETTVQVLNLWAVVLLTGLNLGTLVWNIVSGPSKKNAARLEALAVQLSGVDQRVAQVETKQSALPSQHDMHELELAMERLKGEMKTLSQIMAGHGEIMKRVEAMTARHEDHLLKKS